MSCIASSSWRGCKVFQGEKLSEDTASGDTAASGGKYVCCWLWRCALRSSGKHHAAVGAGSHGRTVDASAPIASEGHQTGVSSRRYYDFAYILVMLLAFPLYWVKVMDWRLCGGTDALNVDPWLIHPPSPDWVESWPCHGSQALKIRHVLSSPAPFLRSLVWPVCFSELHFLTSFYTVVVGGFIMLAITCGTAYDVSNPWRLMWAFLARAQVRLVPILVKLLRPEGPWPVAVSHTLLVDGPASALYSAALMGPVWHVMVGATIDLLYVAIIGRMYGSDWPHVVPPWLLVLLQTACGLVTVSISAQTAPSSPWSCRGQRGGEAGPGRADPLSSSEAGKAAGVEQRTGRRPAGALGLVVDLVSGGSGARRRLAKNRREADLNSATPPPESLPSPPALPHAGSPGVRERQLLSLCRRLARADGDGAAAAATAPLQQQRPLRADGGGDGGCGTARQGAAENGGAGGEGRDGGGGGPCANASSINGSRMLDSEQHISRAATKGSGSKLYGNQKYGDPLSWTHLFLKLPGVEPSALPPGVEERVTVAVAEACPGGAGINVAVRSGCIEIHLDLVRGVAPPVAAGAAAGLVVPVKAVLGLGAEGAADCGGSTGGSQHAPASAEQQELASSILETLGLPPGYDAAVRAQVGSHLLTLTPAAGSGGSWAVLGTRRLQAHELPWVTRVEPPAVVAPAAAATATCGGGHVAALCMTISGSPELLVSAHADTGLEVLALFEGAFLRLTDQEWGPMEGSHHAAAAGGGEGSGGGTTVMALAAAPRIPWSPPSLAVGRRPLTARLGLPPGRTGTVSLVLMRRGMAGQSHPLLLLRPEDVALAAEVEALAARVHTVAAAAAAIGGSGDGPLTSSMTSFVRDLGHWLQYRDFWRRNAAAVASKLAAAGGAAGCGGSAAARSVRLAGRLSASWRRVLLPWSQRYPDGAGGGGGGTGLGLQLLQIKPHRTARPTGQPTPAEQPAAGEPFTGRCTSHTTPPLAPQPHGQSTRLPVLTDDVDLLDQGESGNSGGRAASPYNMPVYGDLAQMGRRSFSGGMAPQAASSLASWSAPPPAVSAAAAAEHQRLLVQGSLPPFGQSAYQVHMSTARRSLLEYALEQRCAAVAAALLEPAPVPRHTVAGDAAAAAAAAYGAASYLAELAESSRAASPDGLTLLHRAVRSGNAATVEVALRAAARAAAAAAPAAATSPAGAGGPTDTAAAAAELGRSKPCLYDWATADAYGITPLHYVAVLSDGGALARHVLRTCPAARAMWDVGGPQDVPSPAAFAAQNGLVIDAAELRRAAAAAEEQVERSDGGGGGAAAEATVAGADGADGAGAAKPHGARRKLLLAALWGFPSGDHERRYQRFARARSQAGGGGELPAWLLLLLQGVAFAAGLLQALALPYGCCRRDALPLLALQGGSLLIAVLCCYPRPTGRSRKPSGACCVAAWALQALALTLLLARSIGPLPRPGPRWLCSCSSGFAFSTAAVHADAFGGVRDGGEYGIVGGGAVGTAAGGCGGAALLHHSLLALHHALAVVAMPYSVPSVLHRVLAVQAMEVMAAVLLLVCMALGCCAAGGAGGGGAAAATAGTSNSTETLSLSSVVTGGFASLGCGEPVAGLARWAGDAAVQVAGGSLLRGIVSSLVVLAADLRARAAFVGSSRRSSYGHLAAGELAPPPAPPSLEAAAAPLHRQQQQHPRCHEKLD